MANFTAKTKELYPVDETQPGDIIPCADYNGLRELGASEFYPRSWEYRDKDNGLDDFMRPGFFTDETRDHLRAGDEIYYVLQGGKSLPSEWVRGICVVEEIPNSRDRPVILAGLVQLPAATPWRK